MLSSLASLSVITPFDVEIIAMPKPFNTRGILSVWQYWRKPGLLMRSIAFIADTFDSGFYFKAILMLPW